MLVRLLAKVKGVLGYDTTATRVYERPLYEYTLEREVTKVTVEGHNHAWNDGEFVVQEANDSVWARWTIYEDAMKPLLGGGQDEVQRVSGVVDWSREPVGKTRWEIDVDKSTATITDVERTTRF